LGQPGRLPRLAWQPPPAAGAARRFHSPVATGGSSRCSWRARWRVAHCELTRGAAGGAQWEMIEGPDMLDFINRCGGRLPEPMAAHYFRQLVDALGAMHACGVVRLLAPRAAQAPCSS